MKKIALLSIILFQLSTLYCQKLYYGFGYHIGFLSKTNISFNYLSESPYFIEPLKVEKHNQLKLNFANGFNTQMGLQFNNSFLEINFVPFNKKQITFNALKIKDNGGGSEETELQYNIRNSEFNIQYKKVLTGRRKFRIAGMLGFGTYLSHSLKTEINDFEKELDLLFYFEPKFHHLVQTGIGYLGFNGENNIAIFLTYSHQLSNYTPELKVGYFQLVTSFLMYHKKAKQNIFINE